MAKTRKKSPSKKEIKQQELPCEGQEYEGQDLLEVSVRCRGNSVLRATIKKGVYESGYFTDGNHQQKHTAIKDFLKKTGLTPAAGVCTGTCSGTKVCLAGTIRVTGDKKGEIDLGLSTVKLFGVTYKRYVLWAKVNATFTLSTSCACRNKVV